jgi:hypothetical protein
MKKTLANSKNDGHNIWMNIKTGFNITIDKLGNSINNLLVKQR